MARYGKILVTGGAGFIGAAVVRHLMRRTDLHIVNLDKLTYAATPEAVEETQRSERYTLEQIDICDAAAVEAAILRHRPDLIMHLAAETHVDRSIDGPAAFIATNIGGTFNLLQAARHYLDGLSGAKRDDFRFHHISTDEVFGALGEDDPPFTERHPYHPNSPYSASKAASDHLVRAWAETYRLPVVLSNCSNNYGPWQFPEKLIPLIVIKAIDGQTLPVYGAGANIRDWLHVDDHAEALWLIASRGKLGESYNVGGGSERRNIDVVRDICRLLDARLPANRPHERLINFVTDRPGHDLRYAIDTAKIKAELGWTPRHGFVDGLAETVDWYMAHEAWWWGIIARRYDGSRVGLAKAS